MCRKPDQMIKELQFTYLYIMNRNYLSILYLVCFCFYCCCTYRVVFLIVAVYIEYVNIVNTTIYCNICKYIMCDTECIVFVLIYYFTVLVSFNLIVLLYRLSLCFCKRVLTWVIGFGRSVFPPNKSFIDWLMIAC